MNGSGLMAENKNMPGRRVPDPELNGKHSVTEKGVKRSSAWEQKLVEGRMENLSNPTRVRMLRLRAKLSQAAAAEKFNLSVTTYAQIENGKRLASMKRADEIARYFNGKLDYLFEKDKKSGNYKAKKAYVQI